MIGFIREKLFSLQDMGYKAFSCKLMPTVDPNTVIGVRTPALKQLAKQILNNPDIHLFLNDLPHKYYEENNLHGFIINNICDYNDAIAHLDRFLPFVDNWATCDGLRPKAFIRNKALLQENINIWLASPHTYTVRFAILMLMTHFLDDSFDIKYPQRIAKIKSDEYYINMMIAWYFATALAKQWDSIYPFIENKSLPKWVHNKTIQKAKESYRITKNQKVCLQELKL